MVSSGEFVLGDFLRFECFGGMFRLCVYGGRMRIVFSMVGFMLIVFFFVLEDVFGYFR